MVKVNISAHFLPVSNFAAAFSTCAICLALSRALQTGHNLEPQVWSPDTEAAPLSVRLTATSPSGLYRPQVRRLFRLVMRRAVESSSHLCAEGEG